MKGILFKTDMVRAILEGRKTMTRRIIKPHPYDTTLEQENGYWNTVYQTKDGTVIEIDDGAVLKYAKHQIGDILYVRETYLYGGEWDEDENIKECRYWYKADHDWQELEWFNPEIDEEPRSSPRWKPSLFMPKAAARIFLEVTGVRAEKLGEITRFDAIEEGIQPTSYFLGEQFYANYSKEDIGTALHPVESFRTLWISINKEWNPEQWVFVYQFKMVEKPC